MSAIVKTITPFIDKKILMKALDALGVKYQVQGNNIITERKDYYGLQTFVWENNRYKFKHDSSAERNEYMRRWGRYPSAWRANWKEWKSVSSFLKAVEKEYNRIYKEQIEELKRKREELERKKLSAMHQQEQQKYNQLLQQLLKQEQEIKQKQKSIVEEQKKAIIEKAKQKGFIIKEEKVGNKIKLILTRAK